MNHTGYMKEAIAEAEKAYTIGEVPIGAVVVLNDQIIGRGHNLRETLKDSTAHAEIVAMREAAQQIGDWRLDGSTVYCTVEPCPMCAGAMIQFRVKTLIYGTQDLKAGAVDSIIDVLREPRFNHQVAVVSGVLEEECREIIQRFFRELRDKKKGN
ncbi:tRNA-adenosine deaminase [Desulfotomaculum arcticum]|uniref:tRNA-specific adenosine deaminase n=1 Tax=Desulfotruncus arcticus DSM 17038 TaxID=1121424 RepID=A0A1I2W8C2_9FIRM|nr:tRNA adenosine(34) deaminase TadA [Desulfotruncus arcticus]SFG97552.1 tRNA-adenosine deaminase [Desulfotomaculum arcticum] [Desulfotruncus arcticus DSM 17038]